MNKKLIVSGVATFAILAAIAGITSTVMAASNTNANSVLGKFGMHQKGSMAQLTDAQKAEIKTKMDAVNTALEVGNYKAWVAAKKAVNENCPALSKITADNFSKYVEAYKLRKQADSILTELGVDDRGNGGFGFSGMRGEGGSGRGMHGGFGSAGIK